MRAVDALAASILILGGTGCASLDSAVEPKAGQELRPFAVGWEQYFTIDWQARTQENRRVVSGTVKNRYGATASRVQLLVEGLDDKGGVLGQHVGWLGRNIGPFESVPFEVSVAPAANYRVTIFAYDQGRGGGP